MFVFKRLWKYVPDVEIYTDKIAESGRRLIRKAYDEARQRNHNQIAQEHIFFAIAELEEPLFVEVMQRLNLNPQVVYGAFDTQLASGDYAGRGIKMSESFRTLMATAVKNARSDGRPLAEVHDFFIALFQDEKSFPYKFFRQLGVDSAMVIQIIRDSEHLIGLHDREPYISKIRKRPHTKGDI